MSMAVNKSKTVHGTARRRLQRGTVVADIKPAAQARSTEPVLPQKWDDRTVFNVEELAEILRTNTWTIYEAIRRKEIPVVRVGE